MFIGGFVNPCCGYSAFSGPKHAKNTLHQYFSQLTEMFIKGLHWNSIWGLHWNSFQCSCTVSMFCTGTVFSVLAQYQGFCTGTVCSVHAQYPSFALEQFSLFLHSIQVLHWNSIQCPCTISRFCTGTVFFLIFTKCSVLVSLEQCTNGTAFQCLFTVCECMALMCCIGTVFNHYLSTLR